MRKPLHLAARFLAAFRRDRRGVSAIEFALISPLLILTYFGLAELSQAVTAQRRTSHAASAIGDLIAQDNDGKITNAEMSDTFSAGATILAPFSATGLNLRVTSLTGDVNGKPTVDWSDVPSGQSGLTAYAAKAQPTLPAGLISAPGENVIMAESTYSYSSPVKYVLKNALNFSEVFYLRPRKGTALTRSAS